MLQCSELTEGDAVSEGCCGSPGEVCCRPRAEQCGDNNHTYQIGMLAR